MGSLLIKGLWYQRKSLSVNPREMGTKISVKDGNLKDLISTIFEGKKTILFDVFPNFDNSIFHRKGYLG